ncbi:hypothetical protein [Ancylobacter sp. SL191]|uniref:hypothetical protein n=1 Tax=Ancylobacter sp. SL191 TaxID=2995166 RepID=UPI00226F37EA|nr:hypothetical protein [Ancylobacter sp. SL191]WAC26512.1 hypothetical protein OU996_16035 [Ancylobacter sp. SL191]
MHHLHLSRAKGCQSYGDDLLYVRFRRNEACLLFVGDHKSFFSGEAHSAAVKVNRHVGLTLVGVEPSDEANLPRKSTLLALHGFTTHGAAGNSAVMASLLTSSGHSIAMKRYSDRILDAIDQIATKILDRSEYSRWFGDHTGPIPHQPEFALIMDHLDFAIYERVSKVLIRALDYNH